MIHEAKHQYVAYKVTSQGIHLVYDYTIDSTQDDIMATGH